MAIYIYILLHGKMKIKNKPKVFEKRVLKNTFGPKRGEVTSEWRKLHNEELW